MIGRITVLISLALIVAGCGTTSQSEQARSVVKRYFYALANGDASEACSLLTGEARERVSQLLAKSSFLSREAKERLAHRAQLGQMFACVEAMNLIHGQLGVVRATELSKAKTAVESISGDTAHVKITTASLSATIPVSKTPAGWLVNLSSLPPDTF